MVLRHPSQPPRFPAGPRTSPHVPARPRTRMGRRVSLCVCVRAPARVVVRPAVSVALNRSGAMVASGSLDCTVTHTRTHARTHARTRVCARAHTQTHEPTHEHTHTHTHTHTPPLCATQASRLLRARAACVRHLRVADPSRRSESPIRVTSSRATRVAVLHRTLGAEMPMRGTSHPSHVVPSESRCPIRVIL